MLSGATYLPVSIRGKSYDCLLNTGSDVTVIPASIVEGLQLQESSNVLTAANGTEITAFGEITLPFMIKNYESTMTGLWCTTTSVHPRSVADKLKVSAYSIKTSPSAARTLSSNDS